VAIRATPNAAPDEAIMRGLFAAENCPHPRRWSGGPGETYDWHSHGYHKILFCISGGIAFRDGEGMTYRLGRGDRLDIDAGSEHQAVAGPEGVECMESFR
jgi:mannose-6-phosphate isomerase-like protein (cupin superfamily)